MDTNTSSRNWSKRGSPTKPWKTASCLAKIPQPCKACGTGYRRARSTHSCQNGYADSPLPSPPKTVRPDTVIHSPLSTLHSPARTFPHSGAGSAGQRTHLLGRCDPRKPGHRSSQTSAAHFWSLGTPSTPGPFRTRVIPDGVIPSLHIDYQETRIQQSHKAGRALPTETTITHTYDFYIGKNLRNLPALRRIGSQANRRLLPVQRISHDCILAEEAFQKINRPVQVTSQRACALRFADPKVQALWRALLRFQLLPTGFCNHHLRQHFPSLLGQLLDFKTSSSWGIPSLRIVPIARFWRWAWRYWRW